MLLTVSFIIVNLIFEAFMFVRVYETIGAVPSSKWKKNFLLLLIIMNIGISMIDIFGIAVYYMALLTKPFIIYYYFRKTRPSSHLNLFVSMLIYLSVSTTSSFCGVFISSFLGDSIVEMQLGLFSLVSTLIGVALIFPTIQYLKLDMTYFEEKREVFTDRLDKLLYILLGIFLVDNLSVLLSLVEHFNSFASILITICFLTILFVLLVLKHLHDQQEKVEELIRKEKEIEQHEKYTDQIVNLYNEIRGFRHDYAGMLVSMKEGIKSGDIAEVNRIYEEVLVNANIQLRSEKYTYFDLNNVGDSGLRSVMMEKLLMAEELELDLTLEVTEHIDRLPVQLLDLVRIASVILDNALEGSAESYHKTLNMTLVNLPREIKFVITNSRKKGNIDIEQIYRPGYSTKGRHRGLGLNNVKEIIDMYDNMVLDTAIDKETFTQVITIKKEGLL